MSSRKIRNQADKDFDFTTRLTAEEAAQRGYGTGWVEGLSEGLPPSELAIVEKSGGIVAIAQKIQLTTTGAVFSPDMSVEEWRAFFVMIKRIKRALQWIIGDWVAYGSEALRWSYDDISELTGYKPKTLREWAYVARNVPMSIRMDKISFGHHQVVAHLPEPDQKKWLEHAIKHKLSVHKLSAIIGESPALPEEDPYGLKRFRRNSIRVRRIVDRVGQGKKLTRQEADETQTYIQDLYQWLSEVQKSIEQSIEDEE